MNTQVFGICHQADFTSIMLQEGGLPQQISDGFRTLIPNVASDQVWGTASLQDSKQDAKWSQFFRHSHNETSAVPRLTDHFWKHIYNHLYNYLGFCAPTLTNGYELVVVPSSVNFQQSDLALRPLIRQAGFDDIEMIPSTYALLLWAMNASEELVVGYSGRVITVVVEETHTVVAAFLLESQHAGYQVIRVSDHVIIQNWGYYNWLKDFHQWFSVALGSDPAIPSLPWLDAVLEFTGRYQLVSKTEAVRWQGIWQTELKRQGQLPAWHAEQFRSYLPSAEHPPLLQPVIDGLLKSVGFSQADKIIIGGSGAVFPFTGEVNSPSAMISRNGPVDLALGATRWPQVKIQHPALSESLGRLTFRFSTENVVLLDAQETAPPQSRKTRSIPSWLK